MTRTLILKTAFLGAALFSAPSFASVAPSETNAVPAFERSQGDAVQVSRRGRGRDDGPNHAMKNEDGSARFARRGADDAAGHTRQGRGTDDGPNHSSIKGDQSQEFARRGRGKDDAPNHG